MLNDKQKRFCEEYMKSFNATDAYKKAGYTAEGHSAEAAANKLLSNIEVQEYLQELRKEAKIRYDIDVDKIITELKHIAYSRITDYCQIKDIDSFIGLDAEGKPIIEKDQGIEVFNTDNLTDGQKAALQEIRQNRKGLSVKTYDKIKALELLAKYAGIGEQELIERLEALENKLLGGVE
jgi:phage terminase small subunit